MKSIFILSTMWIFVFATSLQAYIILDSKTEVSPGCDGGILSHKCTSFISNINTLNDSNSNESDSFDENLDIPDEEGS
jgi:hypothetical protein